MSTPAIGIFDSGVGGLSVLREVRRLLPGERLLYVADQAHVPYGPRPLDEVRRFSWEIARFLLARGAGVQVVACNTASAAALHFLREALPQVTFVGMEPAVKPAALASRTGTIGVIATPATFRGELFSRVVQRFAQGARILTQTCPGLVEAIEAGEADSPATRALLEGCLAPLLGEGIDTLVLGCTHYPLALSAIQAVCGPGVHVVDPSPAVARQVVRVLERQGRTAAPGRGRVRAYTTGSPAGLAGLLPSLADDEFEVLGAAWGAEGGPLWAAPDPEVDPAPGDVRGPG